MDCSLPGSSVHGILQARILEWAAIPFSGDLPVPGIEHMSLTSAAAADSFFTTTTTQEAWADALLKALKKGKVLVTQLCLILCDPMDCNPPGSPAMKFSRQGYWCG